MNEHMRIIFYENPDIDELIRDFCRTDPEYQRIKRVFVKRFCALFGRTDPAVCGDGTYPRDHTPK